MKRHPFQRQLLQTRNAGFTIIELTVTMILLGMLMSLVIPLLGLVNKQQRESERRVVAVQLIDNLMERLTAESYEAITQTAADALELPEEQAVFLPAAKLIVTVTEYDDELTGKQITIELVWDDTDGVEVAPARLTSMVYLSGRES